MSEHVSIELAFPRSVTPESIVAFWSGLGSALSLGHGSLKRPWLIVEVVATPGHVRFLVHPYFSL